MGAVDTNIGFIISVSGSKVTGILVSPDASAGENGEVSGADGVQIGALVKVRTPRSITFGVVSALEIREPSSPPKLTDPRIAEIDLFGEAVDLGNNGTDFLFQRGVSIYPSLGQSIYVTTSVDLARIYACPKSSNVRIGTLHQDSSLPASALTDDLLGKHMSILGTTASGKSCSVPPRDGRRYPASAQSGPIRIASSSRSPGRAGLRAARSIRRNGPAAGAARRPPGPR